MKTKGILLLVLFMYSFYVNAQDSIVLPVNSTYKNTIINVSLQSGSIEIAGHNKNEFVIYTQLDSLSTKTKKVLDKNGYMRLANNSFDIDITNSENRLDIKSYSSRGLKKLIVKVPKSSDLSIITNENGDISIDNVEGKLDITNNSGKIDIKKIRGSLVASCPNGDVKVDFTAIDKKFPSSITSLNGKIEISFPKQSPISFKLQSIEGEIYSNFEMELVAEVNSHKKTNDKGNHSSIKKWMTGSINGGGQTMTISTLNSDVYLKIKND